MEAIPKNEQQKRREWLVANIAIKGELDEEVKEVVGLWLADEEKTRQAINEPNYLLTMDLARIYEEAGAPATADRFLEHAAEDALNFGDEATYNNIMELLHM